LKDSLPGIIPKILSARFKELEEGELIKRHVEAGSFPVKSEYTLTESGIGIIEIIKGMKRWALNWKIDNIACGEQMCEKCVLQKWLLF
jgi:DNA-binding HxlR family transcriptional regulator